MALNYPLWEDNNKVEDDSKGYKPIESSHFSEISYPLSIVEVPEVCTSDVKLELMGREGTP